MDPYDSNHKEITTTTLPHPEDPSPGQIPSPTDATVNILVYPDTLTFPKSIKSELEKCEGFTPSWI